MWSKPDRVSTYILEILETISVEGANLDFDNEAGVQLLGLSSLGAWMKLRKEKGLNSIAPPSLRHLHGTLSLYCAFAPHVQRQLQ
jgi:hypothetical protein